MIVLEGLTKRYGDFTAVGGVDLEVEGSQIFGLLGPNGAGKTTTLRMIAGILKPDSGRVLVGGHDNVAEPMAARRILGFVPDRPFVYDKLTGAELLRFSAGLYGLQGPEIERRIDELLALWDLSPWKDQLVESYSHGMRQKLIISSALIHRPRVLVVDEPMVGLDPRSAWLLKDVLRRFADGGGTALVSTHTLELAESLCDRLAVIDRGRVVAAGSIEDLRQEARAETAGLEEIFLRITRGATDSDIARAVGD
ncbi:MAG: ABC transporter ATP-binding protein [marine benthic group bacterium]|jgi:ABC-2 type transport system ATP-binding protein|nr:ABC transporter ATP-binding protein [Candidatus Benthicola marisminoris]